MYHEITKQVNREVFKYIYPAFKMRFLLSSRSGINVILFF